MMTRATIIALLLLLVFGAFAGMAQTLTCTFQFTGSGTIGTLAFTNAAITVTTVGNTANRQLSTVESYLTNDSASIVISGVGSFHFTVPIVIEAINQTPNVPGAVVNEEFRFGISGQYLVGGTIHVADLWSMLSSFGPITITSGYITGWKYNPVNTSGGVMNFYDSNPTVTFQANVSATPPISVPSRTGVLSHIAAGGGWTTVITLVNTSSAAVPVTVVLHNDDGSALTLPVTTTQQGVSQTITTSSVNATMNPNAMLLISMGDKLSSLSVGWADVLSTGSLGGYAIFRSTPQTGSPSEGTVPLQSQFPSTITLPYDNTAGFVMGIALANMSTSLASVTVTMWDGSGNQLGTQFTTIAGNGHTAFVLPNQFPLMAGKRGIVRFQSSGGIAGLGLRFSPFGTFTSVPTM
jgi:hypothetical protein